MCILLFGGKKDKERTDKEIVLDYIANQQQEYTDEQKVEIVTAYKNMLETEGEEATDMILSQEDQTALSKATRLLLDLT